MPQSAGKGRIVWHRKPSARLPENLQANSWIAKKGHMGCLPGRKALLHIINIQHCFQQTGSITWEAVAASWWLCFAFQDDETCHSASVGGDWGAFISFFLGAKHADHCQAIHTNLPYSSPNLWSPWHVAQTLNGLVPFLNKVSLPQAKLLDDQADSLV